MHSLHFRSESSFYCCQGIVIFLFLDMVVVSNRRRNNLLWWSGRVGRWGNVHIIPLGYLGVSSYFKYEPQVSASIEVEIYLLPKDRDILVN